MKYKKIFQLVTVIGLTLFALHGCEKNDSNSDNGTNTNSTVTDIDGNVYSTIKIGSQTWTVENLKVTKYNDGTPIQIITDTSWRSLTTPAYCWYGNDINSKAPYGALYNWFAVNTGKLAPTGWHIPTVAEWNALENYLVANGYNYDGSTTLNKIAKSLALSSAWNTSTEVGAIGNNDFPAVQNKTGFSAICAGLRSTFVGSPFQDIPLWSYWWTSTESTASNASLFWMGYRYNYTLNAAFSKQLGLSIRCIKN
jgi:uncharacterized protein (TIGR02145 family)